MNNRHPVPSTDATPRQEGRCPKPAVNPGVAALYAPQKSSKPASKVNYIPGEAPRAEPREIPRLFIRGLGGSIKMDLRGLGISFSAGAFAHRVADESLKDLHIHCGDIAVVDPMGGGLRIGDLLLLDLNGHPVLRRLTKQEDIWYLETVDGTNGPLLRVVDYPFQGVVLGFLRLFTKVLPVKYRGTEANFSAPLEVSMSNMETCQEPRSTVARTVRPKARYPKRKPSALILAAETQLPPVQPRT